MKTKKNWLQCSKNVYYFDYRHGVLKGKSTTHLRRASGLMTVVFLFGGIGMGVSQLLNAQDQKRVTSSYQREAPIALQAQKPGEESDKLKSASVKAREDDQLAKQIHTKLKNVPGGQKWSVYVRDLKSNRMASINADNTYEAGSLSNLFVTVPLEAKLPSNNWGYRAGKSTVAKCVETMISKSDAACAQAVSQYADLKNADSVLSGVGFKKTTLTSKQQQTSAREIGDLLFRLQNSQVLSDKARRVVFDGLYSQSMREGIRAGCKQNCLVANIAAESKTIRHEAAIVTSGQSQYVVVVMSNSASWSQIADVSASIQTTMNP